MTVLVVVSGAEDAGPLVRWGARFAQARGETLTVFHTTRGTQPNEAADLPLRDVEDQHPIRVKIRDVIAEACAMLLEDAGDQALGIQARVEAQVRRAQSARDSRRLAREHVNVEEAPDVPERWKEFVTLRGVSHPDPFAATLNEIKTSQAVLVVVGRGESLSNQGAETDLGTFVMEHAACDAMLIRATGNSGQRCGQVLIPAAGGPHAPVALGLAQGLTRAGAEVHPLFVEPEGGDDDEAREVGRRRLSKVLAEVGVDESEAQIKPRVELGDNPTKVIGSCAQDGYDLVLVGASNHGFIQRLFFKTLPEELLAGDGSVAMAVVRRGTLLRERLGVWLGDFLERYAPRLSRDDRLALYRSLEVGSRFDKEGTDFLTLIALSTGIASLGLIQNSPAVVIGAMLVAPLMTPMVGAGLALVQDNVVVAKQAARSILYGFLTALFIGILMGLCAGWVMPEGQLTSELLARGGPNALDLGVALLSGLAAAYAIARPNLSGALPGVAIAAALVPPIGTAGISLATGHFANAQGAALLFAANLVAIVLGASAMFWLIGVRPHSKGKSKRRLYVRRIVILLVIALGALTVPLGLGLLDAVTARQRQVRLTDGLLAKIEARVTRHPETSLVTVRRSHTHQEVEIVLAGIEPAPQALVDDLARIVAQAHKHPVATHVVTVRRGWTRTSVAPVGSQKAGSQ